MPRKAKLIAMHERPRTQVRQEFLLQQCELRRRRRRFAQLVAQRVSTLAPDIGQSGVAIGQLLRVHTEQPRPATRPEMHTYYMNVATGIEHEILRLRAVHDGAVERHPDMIGRVREHLQIVGSEIERKIDTTGGQRTATLAIRVAAAHVPELVDERRQRRCGPIAEHLHDELHRGVEAAS
jgi:hypothetical protein